VAVAIIGWIDLIIVFFFHAARPGLRQAALL